MKSHITADDGARRVGGLAPVRGVVDLPAVGVGGEGQKVEGAVGQLAEHARAGHRRRAGHGHGHHGLAVGAKPRDHRGRAPRRRAVQDGAGRIGQVNARRRLPQERRPNN